MKTIRKHRRPVPWLLLLVASVAAADEAIEEIVVTADFRERVASEVPASITVFDGEDVGELATQHFEELVYAVPNLNWSGDGHRARYFQIRGVGELEQYQGAPNPSVGFLIDDIDFSGIGTIATLFDIGRVEVLRGPQGTRYGANALGGLIYLRSAEPTEDFEGRVEATVGDDGTLAGGIALGGSLNGSDTLMYRLSAHHHRSDGFRENTYLGRSDTNGRDETTARARLSWLPGTDWRVDVATLFSDVDDGYDAFALDNGYTMLSDKPGQDAQRSVGVSVRAEYSGRHGIDLTSITAFADSDIDFSFDADWGNDDSWAPVTYDYVSLNDRQRDTLSQEFRLSTEQWLVGIHAMRLDENLATLNLGEYYDPGYDWADSLDYPFDSRYEASNAAVFAQYERDAGPTDRLEFGLRAERRDADYSDTDGLRISRADSMLGGALTLTSELSERHTSYVSLAKGYKAGGFNLGDVPGELREFAAEDLWSIEGGVKGSFLDSKLSLNVAAFLTRREDQQVRVSLQLVRGDPASFRFLTVNAARAKSRGIEFDMNWVPNDGWTVYASLGLLDTRFDEFELNFDPGNELVGREQAHAPRYTISAGAAYRHPSGFMAGIDLAGRDEFYFDVSHDQKSQAYELAHVKIGYEAEAWSLALRARNVFDKYYAVRGFYFGNEPPDFPDALYTRAGDPRHMSLTFDMRF